VRDETLTVRPSRERRHHVEQALRIGGRVGALVAALLVAAAASGQTCEPWSVVPSPDAPGAHHTFLRAIHAVGADDVWAVGESTHGSQIRAVTMHWDGTGWSVVPAPVPHGDFATFGMWAVGGVGTEVWAAGHRQYTPDIPYAFFGTHNAVWRWDGAAWQLQVTPALGGGSGDMLWGMAAIAQDDIWFVGDGHPTPNGPQPALAMRWNGAGFELHDVPIVNPEAGQRAGNPLFAVSAVASDDVWAVGGTDINAIGSPDYSNIHRWNGTSWSHVPGPTPGFFNKLVAVAAAAPDDVWAAGEYWDADGIFPLLIHWDGSSWSQVPAPGGFLDMIALAPDDIWAVGGAIYHFDGTSWSVAQLISGVPFPSLSGVTGFGSCQMWAAGRQFDGEQFHTLTARVVDTAPVLWRIFIDGFESGTPAWWGH
jgi:hypothetical protein